ncbi:MAG: hypothetical protein ACI9OD_003015 [Limisphaerales bacterium]|jgi:hypothetical protein
MASLQRISTQPSRATSQGLGGREVNRWITSSLLWMVALMSPVCGEASDPLSLTSLLRSVDHHHPSIIAAMREQEAVEGAALSAEGAFDLRLKFNSRNDPLGFYETRVLEALIEQPTRYLGTKVYGGWRRGDGLFPLQEEKLETQFGGEILFGVSAPLLRDRNIDAARAGLQQAGMAVEAAQARFELVRLSLQQSATEKLLKLLAALENERVHRKVEPVFCWVNLR